MLLLVLSCSLSLLQQPRPPLGLGLRPALLCGRRVAIVMAADEAAAQRAEQADRAAAALAQLPPGLYNRVSFQSGGMKQAYAEEECLVLWEALKACYPTEADALAAVDKNSMTVNPSMNSPSKITETHALLVERFGAGKASEIIMQNPGILTCTAAAVAAQSDDEILGVTALVAKVDENKGKARLLVLGGLLSVVSLAGTGLLARRRDLRARGVFRSSSEDEKLRRIRSN
mmetsp:Transcript_35846/g.115706  ORF Transcript_35846/g.115706 Transcript_35846/m.115706 type:complete len:230 (-) Transcript_35846:286-975(-)